MPRVHSNKIQSNLGLLNPNNVLLIDEQTVTTEHVNRHINPDHSNTLLMNKKIAINYQ